MNISVSKRQIAFSIYSGSGDLMIRILNISIQIRRLGIRSKPFGFGFWIRPIPNGNPESEKKWIWCVSLYIGKREIFYPFIHAVKFYKRR